MTLPAARATDMLACPAWNGPGAPHATGAISAGCPTVLIEGKPAARMGDASTCAGPPGTVTSGSPVVLIGGQMAARVTDLAQHGGIITGPGALTVLIGGPAPPPPPPPPPEPEPPEEEEEES